MKYSSTSNSPAATNHEVQLHEPGHLFRRAHQMAVQCFYETFGREVTPLQYASLRVLEEHPGIDQVTLAAAIALDTSTAAEIAVRLERNGWISREVGPRRQRRLELTESGASLVEGIRRSDLLLSKKVLHRLSEQEGRQLMRLMQKLLDPQP